MNLADQIYQEVRRLPEPLAQEVFDFIGYLEAKHGLPSQGVEEQKEVQAPVMGKLWDNPEDEVWDEW